jgi:Putative peptidoglycan binding domain
MMNALFLLGLLWALCGRSRGNGGGSGGNYGGGETEPKQLPSGGIKTTTPPWPAVVPGELPRFPGAGWEFDEPPPPAVQQRAGALVSPLWARGSGAYQTEMTAGRWITYQAQVVRSGKKGVVAYRQRQPKQPTTAAVPAGTPVSTQAPAVVPPPVAPRVSTMALPTLRYGRGLQPAAADPEVRVLQQRLSIPDDGRFGAGTLGAVKRYQTTHGLAPDGVVGPATWSSLFATTTPA